MQKHRRSHASGWRARLSGVEGQDAGHEIGSQVESRELVEAAFRDTAGADVSAIPLEKRARLAPSSGIIRVARGNAIHAKGLSVALGD